MSTLELRLKELRNSVALAAEVSVEPKTIPDWWKNLSDGGRRNYLVNHPKSKYRNMEVMEAIKGLDDKQRGELARFLTKLTGPKGLLTKAAEAKITPEAVAKIPPKDQKQIADLLRAAHGDQEAKARVKNTGDRLKKVRGPKVGDYFDKERKPKNKVAQQISDDLEKKLGRAANYNELKTGLRDHLAAKKAAKDNPAATPAPGGTAPTPKTDAPAGAPGNPDAPAKPAPKKPNDRKKERGEDQENGMRATAMALASLGLLVVGGVALVAAGVPVDVFTPELVRFVWKDLPAELTGKKDADLVQSLGKAIKSKFAAGNTNKELEAAMIGKGEGGESGKPATNTDDVDTPAEKPKRKRAPKAGNPTGTKMLSRPRPANAKNRPNGPSRR